MVNFEQHRDAEPASQHHLDYLMQLGGHCLVAYGDKTGDEPTYQMPDKTAVYIVPDEKQLANITAYVSVLTASDLARVGSEALDILELGSELQVSYTPEHYLHTPTTGRYDWYAESIHATIATRSESDFKEKNYSVAYQDPDDRRLVGLRHTMPRGNKTEIMDGQETGSESLTEFVYTALRKNLSEMSKAECKALVEVMRTVGRLY